MDLKQNEKAIFSIIVPVLNASRSIERMLASFISSREYILEVILIDDGTTDDTFEKISPFNDFFPIKVLKNPGAKGPGPARRAGILASSGEWFTFVDSDDCLTASSLYYVYKKILENPDANMIKGKTIFFESGTFNSNLLHTVGGSFYRREYMLEHKLLPHKSLFMAEDSYFMDLTHKFIIFCDNCAESIIEYEYPVYEVHHDTDFEFSFGLENWVNYAVRYQLECKDHILEYFSKYDSEEMKEMLFNDFAINFIFSFYLMENALLEKDINCNKYEQYRYFRKSLEVLENELGKTADDVITYYRECNKEEILKCAIDSAGYFIPFLSFEKFMNLLIKLKH